MTDFNIKTYDYYLIMFSGGKDSLALLLYLLDMGISNKKIELWHHLIDGQNTAFMDWECTEDHARKLAAAFDVPIYYSWKEEGFKGELLRKERPSRPNHFETPDGVLQSGGKGKSGTRLMFPQLSNNLMLRWCSAYLKIDVGTTAIINQKRFQGKRTLVLSGERAQEGKSREHYSSFQIDRADNRHGINKRHVDRC